MLVENPEVKVNGILVHIKHKDMEKYGGGFLISARDGSVQLHPQ
jgi:hypothetical protein